MESYEEEVALLVAQAGPMNGQRWSLRSTIILGRDVSCDIAVPDRQISRYHAKLTLSPNGILLEDLDSKNGTHWNGKSITEAVLLQDGDIIQLALSQQFVFLSSDATVPLDVTDIDLLSVPSPDLSPNHPASRDNGRLRLEPRSRRVWINLPIEPADQGETTQPYTETEISPPLSAYQFGLLQYLYNKEGQVIPRMELIRAVWGKDQTVVVTEQALDALVRRLRDRLAGLDPSHEYIVTVRGHGLRLDNPPLLNGS